MPLANQYLFPSKELVEVLIKESGVHEGKWYLMVNFGIAAGNYGPTKDQLSPGVVVGITQIGIQRADQNTPPEMIVDARDVNPEAAK